MRFLLDTNICIYVINKRPPHVIERFRRFPPRDLGVSTVTVSEPCFGVTKSNRPDENRKALSLFLTPLDVTPYDHEAARIHGDIRVDLERKGQPIGPLDTMIAAHALSLEVPVVTNSVNEFRRVNGVLIENWVEDEQL